MASLKAAVATMTFLVIAAVATSWATARTLAMIEPGVELALSWRLALALANWFVRLEPWLAIFGVGTVALVGAALSRGTTIPQERRVLLGWLSIVGTSAAFDSLSSAMLSKSMGTWLPLLALPVGFGMVSFVASIVVASHLQHRLGAGGAPIKGWHVIAASAVLAVFGPLALLPPIAVWAYSGWGRKSVRSAAR